MESGEFFRRSPLTRARLARRICFSRLVALKNERALCVLSLSFSLSRRALRTPRVPALFARSAAVIRFSIRSFLRPYVHTFDSPTRRRRPASPHRRPRFSLISYTLSRALRAFITPPDVPANSIGLPAPAPRAFKHSGARMPR